MKKISCFLPHRFAIAYLQAQKTSFVNGGFIAPADRTVVLQNNYADIFSLAVKTETNSYKRNVSTFPKQLVARTKYNVSVKPAPALIATKITNGQGLLPIAGNAVRVECNYKFDLFAAPTGLSNKHFSKQAKLKKIMFIIF